MPHKLIFFTKNILIHSIFSLIVLKFYQLDLNSILIELS
jgi:hypothetical protein